MPQRRTSRREAAKREILSLFPNYPFCTLQALEDYLVKQKHLMTKSEYIRSLKDLRSTYEVCQPKAGCLAACVNGQYSNEFLEYIQNFGYNPISSIESPLPGIPITKCSHQWKTIFDNGRFVQVCSRCGEIVHVRKCVPGSLSHLLNAAVHLPAWKVSEGEVRSVVGSLNLPDKQGRHVWDVYACLVNILRAKSGLEPKDLFIRSRILQRLLEVYKNPSQLKRMSRASRRRYSFVIETLKNLSVRLES
jgi:hypothetical protein